MSTSAEQERDARLFLETLYGGRPDGLIAITIAPAWDKPHCVKTPADAPHYVVGKRDVYYRLGLVRHPPKKRGTEADTIGIPGVWAEFDVNGGPKNNGDTVKDGAPSIEAAIELAHSVLQPTAMVRSGYGLHAYWCFEQPWALAGDDDRAAAKRLVQGWQARLRQEAKKAGIARLDSTHDLARVFRVPGSFNGKADAPAPVVLLDDGGPRYTIEQIADETIAIIDDPPPASARGSRSAPGRSPEKLLEDYPELASIARREGKAPGDGTGHAWDWVLASEARKIVEPPVTEAEAIALLAHARGLHDDPGGKGERVEDYLRPTVLKAFAKADKDNKPRATDVGNAARFAAQHHDKARYVAGIGWHVWNGKCWKPDRAGGVERLARRTARSILAEAAAADSDEERKTLAGWALRSESEPRLRAMLSLAESERALVVLPEALDADPWAFNVLNGTLDLRTAELRAHDRSDLITKLAPVEYDPEAHSEEWEGFLATTCEDNQDLIGFLRRASGYSATGSTREEKLFFPHGPGGTGKSTFIDAVRTALGPYAETADFETFLRKRGDGGVRNDIAGLAGARLVASVEVEDGKRLAEGLISWLTGGDTVKARFLYHELFEFRPQFKLWMAANRRPKVDAANTAMWRRILQIPFVHVIPEAERDETLKERFKTDPEIRKAVLAWIVHGCLEWQRDGLQIPEVVGNYTEEYRVENDPLREWLADECELGPEHWTSTKDLRGSYAQWCEANGTKPVDLTAPLKSHDCVAERRNPGRQRGWSGIRLGVGRVDR